jgi:hypothetical protein
MFCRKVKKNLTAYFDKELKPEEMEAIKNHIYSCTKCRSEYEILVKNFNALETVQEIEPGEFFEQNFYIKLNKAKLNIREKVNIIDRIKEFFTINWRIPAFSISIITIIFTSMILLNSLKHNNASDEFNIATNFEFYKNYEIISNLEMLEDYEIVKNLGSQDR